MKKISISRLVIKNFRSFSEADITFPQTAGLRLLSGNNLVQQSLGSNGSGKSSLFGALLFCLYGGKISSVLQWGTEKVEVTVELQIDNTTQIIHRYGPPMRLELNGNATIQDEIDTLLGLSKNRFLHSVLFGQAAQLFPDLSQSERGELLDSVLNLSIWQRCSETASTRHKFLEADLTSKLTELSYIEGKLAGLLTEEDLQDKINFFEKLIVDWKVDNEQALEDLLNKKQHWETDQIEIAETKSNEIEKLEKEILTIRSHQIIPAKNEHEQELFDAVSSIETNIADIHSFTAVAKEKYDRFEMEEKFWTASICPACRQQITKEKKDSVLAPLIAERKALTDDVTKATKDFARLKIELDKKRDQLNKVVADSAREAEQRRAAMREEAKVRSHITMLQKDVAEILLRIETGVDPYSKQIEAFSTKNNPYIIQRDEAKKQAKALGKERKELVNKKSELDKACAKTREDVVALEYWKHGFKHIRLFFVEQILAILQIEIQSAINTLGLNGWTVLLKTETETKSGTTRLGVNISVASPQSKEALELSAFSGGEGQRLRISVALGLANLIQRSAGVKFDVQIWDEPTNFLSSEGIEDLLECFRNYSHANNCSLWTSDHRVLQASSFDEIWTCVKDEQGSRVERSM